MKYTYLAAIILVSACSPAIHPCPPATSGDVAYVIAQGWHTEIALPVEELGKNMQFYKTIFPGARVIMFSYGKKTFITAPAQSFSEYILGPIPGPAAINVVGIRVTPDKAYSPEDVITLALPAGGREALSEYLWRDLAKDAAGKPEMFGQSKNPQGLFYLATSGYSLTHTCNSWTIGALQAAGLPVSPDGVIFSNQAINQAGLLAEKQCH